MANHTDILMTGKATILLIRAFVNRFLHFCPNTKFKCCQRFPPHPAHHRLEPLSMSQPKTKVEVK